MTVKNFSQLVEMLDPNKVQLRMSKKTYRYILEIGFSIDPNVLKDEDVKNKLDGISIQWADDLSFQNVEFLPSFVPRIGDGFTIQVITP